MIPNGTEGRGGGCTAHFNTVTGETDCLLGGTIVSAYQNFDSEQDIGHEPMS